MNQILTRRQLYAGSDQKEAFESNFQVAAGEWSFDIKATEFIGIDEIGRHVDDQLLNLVFKAMKAKKGLLGFQSEEGQSLYFKVFQGKSGKAAVVLSFGETQPMLFRLVLEGIWEY